MSRRSGKVAGRYARWVLSAVLIAAIANITLALVWHHRPQTVSALQLGLSVLLVIAVFVAARWGRASKHRHLR